VFWIHPITLSPAIEKGITELLFNFAFNEMHSDEDEFFSLYNSIRGEWRPSSFAQFIKILRDLAPDPSLVRPEFCIYWRMIDRKRVVFDGKKYAMKRLLYMWYIGIDPGKQHLIATCKDKSCLNPFHMQRKFPNC